MTTPRICGVTDNKFISDTEHTVNTTAVQDIDQSHIHGLNYHGESQTTAVTSNHTETSNHAEKIWDYARAPNVPAQCRKIVNA